MSWKNYTKSIEFFNKLKDTSKMAKDLETMMYSYKQIGYCLS